MAAKELGAQQVANIWRRGSTHVGGVRGLVLNVTMYGSRSWLLRYQVGGRRRDLGLGSYPSVTLAQARDLAREARLKLARGIDPVADAQRLRTQLAQEMQRAITFADAATKYIDAHEKGWKNIKHVAQWRSSLATYANPVLGRVPVAAVDVEMVLRVIEPMWTTKTETANRVRGRIESVLDWAVARGYRKDANPARWKGLLDKLLPAPAKVTKTVHHRAMPYTDLPAFMVQLRSQEGNGALALQFLILTATRSGEVRGARWDEIDIANRVWTIPAERMKAHKEHRVPLSDAAIEILKNQRDVVPASCLYVFPGYRASADPETGAPLSNMTLTAVLRRLNVNAVPHGFRSTFRDWCAEKTQYANEVAEMALAHTVASKVEAAYRRGDMLEKRHALMQDWGSYTMTGGHTRGQPAAIKPTTATDNSNPKISQSN